MTYNDIDSLIYHSKRNAVISCHEIVRVKCIWIRGAEVHNRNDRFVGVLCIFSVYDAFFSVAELCTSWLDETN